MTDWKEELKYRKYAERFVKTYKKDTLTVVRINLTTYWLLGYEFFNTK